VWKDYKKAFEDFQQKMFQKLNQKQVNDDLRFLCFKLDFNCFYEKQRIRSLSQRAELEEIKMDHNVNLIKVENKQVDKSQNSMEIESEN
jgi:hypothetical protein